MHRLVLLAIAYMLVGVPPAMGQDAGGPTEASTVAQAVMANRQWMTDAKRCPALVMPSSEAKDHLLANNCKPGALAGCLARCTDGAPGPCYWLAIALQEQGAAADSFEALYQRSCRLGVVSGCTNRAAGMFAESPRDKQTQACAAATYEAACTRDDPWGCTMHALHLSHGMGVQRDTARALQVLGKSCRYGRDDEACVTAERVRRDILARDPTIR